MYQIDGEQFNKILRYIRLGIDSGATLTAGGERAGSKGFYIQPTIFSDVKVICLYQFYFLCPYKSVLYK